MLSSWLKVLTIAAPMRRPVKEPGPEKKVIFLRSWKVLLCSARWFFRVSSSFSAISLPRLSLYSHFSLVFGFSRVIFVVKSEVSKYKFIF